MASEPKRGFQAILQEQAAAWRRTKELIDDLLGKLNEYNCVIHKWIKASDADTQDVLLESGLRKSLLQELEQSQLRIILLGPNSAGKSSLLNAMLGASLMNTGTGHVTGRVCCLRYALSSNAHIRFRKLSETGELQSAGRQDLSLVGVPLEQLRGVVQEVTARPQAPMSELEYKGWAETIVEVLYPFPLLESGPELWDSPGTSSTDDPVVQYHLRQVLFHLSPVPLFVYRNPTFGDAELCTLRLLDEIYFSSASTDAPSGPNQAPWPSTSPRSAPSPPKLRGVFFLNTFADVSDVMANLDEEEMGDPAALELAIQLDTQSRLAILCLSQAATMFPELKAGYDAAPFACASAMDFLLRRQTADKRWKTMLDRLIAFCADIDARRQQRCLRIAKSVVSLFFFFKDQAERLKRNEPDQNPQASRVLLQFQSRLKESLEGNIDCFRATVLAGLRSKHDALLKLAETLTADGYEDVPLNEAQLREAGGALKDKLARYVDQTVIEPAISTLRQQVHRVLLEQSRALVTDPASAATVESVLSDTRALAVAIRPMVSTERAITQMLLMPVSVTTTVARLLMHTATGGVRLDAKAKRNVADGLLKQIAESTEKCDFGDLRGQVAQLGAQWSALFQRVAEQQRNYLARIRHALNDFPLLFDSLHGDHFLILGAHIVARLTLLKGRSIHCARMLPRNSVPLPLIGQCAHGIHAGQVTQKKRKEQSVQSLISFVSADQPLNTEQLLLVMQELPVSLIWKRQEKAIRQEAPQRACLLLLRGVALSPENGNAPITRVDLAYEGGDITSPLRPLSTLLAEQSALIPLDASLQLMRAIAAIVVELQRRGLDRTIPVTPDTVIVSVRLDAAAQQVARVAPFLVTRVASAAVGKAPAGNESKDRPSKKQPPRLPSDHALHSVLCAVQAKSEKLEKGNRITKIRAARAVLARLTKRIEKGEPRSHGLRKLVPDLPSRLKMSGTNSPARLMPHEPHHK